MLTVVVALKAWGSNFSGKKDSYQSSGIEI
jgi:hypothetical protein